MNSDFLTLDPAMSTAFIDREFFYQVFTPLVQLNLDTSFAPGLAEKWEVKDPKTYIFTLRQGVKFHDGTVLDSSVAKWNFARMQDKSSGSERISELSPVQQVVASSPNTIELQLNAPYAPLLATLTDRAGMMVSEAAAKKYGKNFATNPVGTGPFQFVEWKQQDHLTVKRFDGYYESGKPYLDQIIYHPVENQEVQLTNLRTGQMQFIDNVAPKDLSTITSNSSLKLYQKPGLNYHYFDLNNAKPPFNNKALRQAVAWAVDRASVHKIIYYQTGAIAQGPLAPTSWAYDPNFKPYSPTPAKVKASLAAGSQPNGFSFTLITVATPAELQFTQLVQSQLKAVGITMKIQSAENSALSNALTTGDFEAVHAAWSGRVDPDGNMFYYYTKDGSFNFRKYYNPKVESLLTEARQETDQNKRKQLYLQAQVLVVDDAPLVYFHHNAILHGTSTKLHGYEVYPDGMMRFGDNWLE